MADFNKKIPVQYSFDYHVLRVNSMGCHHHLALINTAITLVTVLARKYLCSQQLHSCNRGWEEYQPMKSLNLLVIFSMSFCYYLQAAVHRVAALI